MTDISTLSQHTWTLSNRQLEELLDDAWSWLSPESEEILGNVGMLPIISELGVLLYRNQDGEILLFLKLSAVFSYLLFI